MGDEQNVEIYKNKSCHHRMTYAPYKRFDRSYEHFSKPKRRFRNLNIFEHMERPCPYTHAYQI